MMEESRREEMKARDGIKLAFSALGLMAVVAGIIIGGWQAHWWLAQSSTNHQSHILRSGYGNQQTLRDQITKNLGTLTDLDSQIIENPVSTVQLTAQRRAIANIVCQDAEQVTGDALPADQVIWVNNNCVMGSAK
jgi:hypothetical protein